jgi:aldehyde:ferredoxin oxidoreductase
MDDMAAMLHAVTGLNLDPTEMKLVAQRVFTLERAYIMREGITRADDVLQGKWVKEGVKGGRYDGRTIDPEKWQTMLEDYYRARGWDPASGIPTQQTLKMLSLDDVADDLQQRGFEIP